MELCLATAYGFLEPPNQMKRNGANEKENRLAQCSVILRCEITFIGCHRIKICHWIWLMFFLLARLLSNCMLNSIVHCSRLLCVVAVTKLAAYSRVCWVWVCFNKTDITFSTRRYLQSSSFFHLQNIRKFIDFHSTIKKNDVFSLFFSKEIIIIAFFSGNSLISWDKTSPKFIWRIKLFILPNFFVGIFSVFAGVWKMSIDKLKWPLITVEQAPWKSNCVISMLNEYLVANKK